MKNLIHLLKKVMCYTIIFVYVAKDSKATNVISKPNVPKTCFLLAKLLQQKKFMANIRMRSVSVFSRVYISALNYKVSFMCCLSLYIFDQMHGTMLLH